MATQLKKARIEAGYSLEEVASALNIRKQYLIALEEGNFEIIPGQVYIDGYLKLYAKYLKVNLFEEGEEKEEYMPIQMNLTNNKVHMRLVIVSIILLSLVVILYNSLIKTKNEIENSSTIENSE